MGTCRVHRNHGPCGPSPRRRLQEIQAQWPSAAASIGCMRSRGSRECGHDGAREYGDTTEAHAKQSEHSAAHISGRSFENHPEADHKRCKTWLHIPAKDTT